MLFFVSFIVLVLNASGLLKFQNGINAAGYTYTVREGGEVDFDPVGTCGEAFLFPGYVFDILTASAPVSTIVPCSHPSNSTSDPDESLGISSEVYCYSGSRNMFKLTCFLNNQAVSRRTEAFVDPDNNTTISTRIGCENGPLALQECIHSVANAILLKNEINSFNTPKEQKTAGSSDTDEQENPQEASPESDTTQGTNERRLSLVAGVNKAKFDFEISNGGLVTFLPRVGQQCTETHIVPNATIEQLLSALTNTTIVPCGAFPKATTTESVDPSWTIIPTVDCSDPVYISISCAVSFSPGEPTYALNRRAIYQAADSRTFLSRRIGCNGITDNEILECSTAANNLALIISNIPN